MACYGIPFERRVGKHANDDHPWERALSQVLEKLELAESLINRVLIAVESGSDEVGTEDLEQLAWVKSEIRSVSAVVRDQL